MAATLSALLSLAGSAVYGLGSGEGVSINPRVAIGAGDWATMITGFSTGSADTVSGNNGLGQKMYADQLTLGAGATGTFNLTDGTLTVAGAAQVFTKVKLVLVQIVSPDGTKSLQVGALGNANAFQGPEGGTGASNYTTMNDWMLYINHKWAGYAIAGAGAGNILSIKNPGAGSVTYNILIIGR